MKGLKATGERFIQMPKDVWEDIFKTLFWDKIFGDYLNSQAIAENFFDAIWGSGPGGAAKNIRAVQRFLISKGYKIKDDGAMGMNTVKALNAYANTKTKELEVVNVQLKERKEFYDALAKQGYQWAKFYNGWMNRLNDLYARSTELINSSGGKIIGGVLLAGIAGYIAYRLAGSPAIKVFS
jgi:lysozyme family protein